MEMKAEGDRKWTKPCNAIPCLKADLSQLPDTRVLRALVPVAPFLKTKYPRGPFPPQADGCTLPSPSEEPLLCAYSGNVFSFLPGLVLT